MGVECAPYRAEATVRNKSKDGTKRHVLDVPHLVRVAISSLTHLVVVASAVSVVCGKKGQYLMGSSINSNTYSAGRIYNTAHRLSRLGLGKVYRRCRENSEKSLINSE